MVMSQEMSQEERRCDVCGDVDEFYSICPNCHACICEGCDVHRCDEGRHDCPKCGTKLADCSPG